MHKQYCEVWESTYKQSTEKLNKVTECKCYKHIVVANWKVLKMVLKATHITHLICNEGTTLKIALHAGTH